MGIKEQLIRFQNLSEKEFVERKSFRNVFNYIVALIIFIISTLYASFSLPIRFLFKALHSKSNGHIINVNYSNFKMLIETNNRVMLNFTAHWCGPCILMGNTLDELAKDHKEVQIGKINVDTNSKITKEFNIKGVPQFVFLINGKEVRRHAGPMTKKELQQFISN